MNIFKQWCTQFSGQILIKSIKIVLHPPVSVPNSPQIPLAFLATVLPSLLIAFTISHGSCNEMLLITSSTFIVKAQPLFQNEAILRRFGMENFTDGIETAITLINRDFKNSIITRIVVNYVFKENFCLYFLI